MNFIILFALLIFRFYKKILDQEYVQYFYKRNLLKGQDKLFIMNKEDEYKNYPMVVYKLEDMDEDLYDFFISKYTPVVDDKKSIFRLETDNITYRHTDIDTKDILSYSFKKIDTVVNVDKLSIAKETSKNSNKIKMFIANDGFIICGSHLLHNSISLFNLTQYVLNIKKLKLPYYRYIPFYNEMLCLTTLPKMYNIYKNYKQSLSLDYPWKTSDVRDIVKTSYKLSFIKKLKNNYPEKISFSILFASIQALLIYMTSEKEQLIIGVSGAFSNKTHFNNFSAIPVITKRPNNLSQDKIQHNIYNIVGQMIKQVKLNKNLMATFYSTSNIYNFQLEPNQYFDILCSGIPMTNQDLVILNKKKNKIKSTYGTMAFHTSPVYILYLSDNKTIHISQHIRTNDVNLTELKKLNNIFSQDNMQLPKSSKQCFTNHCA